MKQVLRERRLREAMGERERERESDTEEGGGKGGERKANSTRKGRRDEEREVVGFSPSEDAREEEYTSLSGKGTDDYWAPKPRITGITPGICNRALGRQSATDFAILPLLSLFHFTPFSLVSSLAASTIVTGFPLFSFFPFFPIARTIQRVSLESAFNSKPRHHLSSLSRLSGNLQITIMEEKKKGPARAMLLNSRPGAVVSPSPPSFTTLFLAGSNGYLVQFTIPLFLQCEM